MCGIAGFTFEVDRDYVFDTLYHRGPDERGFFEDETIKLFHTRLSIQDIANAHQPFIYRNYILLFNGEIYNHLELRKRLGDFYFKTRGDTETLLYYFLRYGKKGLRDFDGMWAFALYDKSSKKLFLSRDRSGKKPLYIYQKGKRLGFGSELALFKKLDVNINEEEIKKFLSFGFLNSPYKEVREIEPGSVAEIDIATLRKEVFYYFDIYKNFEKAKIKDKKEALKRIDEALSTSVRQRVLSTDVGFGAFLSGGIDSALVVAKASEFAKVNTYTVKFEGSFDESHLASLVAKRYETNHTQIEINLKSLQDDIVKIVSSYGKPFFDSSAIPSFYVSREARKYEKVVLNGDGADELVGGYRRYVISRYHLEKFASFLPNLKGEKRGLKLFLQRLKNVAKGKGVKKYNALLNDLIYYFEFKDLDAFYNAIDLDEFDKNLYLDFIWNLRYDLLVKIDIATMQNSLEARSPFLSKYMLDLAPSIDKSLKIKNFQTKYILREYAKKYLPQELITAPKRGFEIPLVQWVENELKDVIEDYIAKGFHKNFIDLERILEGADRVRRAKIKYLIFALEVWYEDSLS